MEEITGIDTSQIEGHDDSEVYYKCLDVGRGTTGGR